MDQGITTILAQIKSSQDYFQKAKLILFLKREKGLKVSDIARQLDLKPSYTSHLLRLNRLPDLIKDGYYSHLVSISHLFIISRLKSDKQISEAYEKVLADDLNTQQTESMVREILYQLKDRGEYLTNQEREELAKNFNGASGIKTKIIQSRLKAKLTIEIKGNLEKTTAELKRIMKLLRNGS